MDAAQPPSGSVPAQRCAAALRCHALLLGVLLVYAGLMAFANGRLSPAVDEPNHVRSGLTMLSGAAYVDAERAWWTGLDPLHPPADMLPGLLAHAAGQGYDFRTEPQPAFRAVRAARLANHLWGAALLIAIYVLALRLYGRAGANVAVLLLAGHPLFLAHASIVSSDLTMAVGTLIGACVVGHAAVIRFETKRPVVCLTCVFGWALLLALAVACKVSNLLFLGLLPLAWIAQAWRMRRLDARVRQLGALALMLVGSLLLAWLLAALLWDGVSPVRPPIVLFGAQVTLPLGHALQFSADLAGRIQDLIALPIYALDWLRQPSWKLYVLALALKTPWIFMLACLIASGVILRATIPSRVRGWTVAIFALAGGLLLLFATRGIYLGLRHLLPVLMLLALGCGVVASPWRALTPGRRRNGLLVLAGACYAASVLPVMAITPHWLAWFHRPWRGSAAGPPALVDSDSDWGQGLLALRDWQRAHASHTPIALAYFGNARPEDYGVLYRGLPAPMGGATPDPSAQALVDPQVARQQAAILAISATHLAGSYLGAQHLPPDYYARWRTLPAIPLAGGTILIYDLRPSTAGE